MDTQAPVGGLSTQEHTKEAVATETPTGENNKQETTNIEHGMLHQTTTTITKLSTSTFSSNIHNYSYPTTYPKNYPNSTSSFSSKSNKRSNRPYLGKIKLQHLNVRSMFSDEKYTNLKNYIQENNQIDIFFISETWLTNWVNDSTYTINGYDFYRKDCMNKGGGVCIYVRENLKVTEIIVKEPIEGIEELWLKVQSGFHASFIVSAIYNHPNNKIENILKLEERFQDMLLKKKNIYVLGDLNFNMQNKDNMLSNIIKRNNLYQIIDKPTRIESKIHEGISTISKTLIDVLITNNPKSIKNHSTNPTPLETDHNNISATINITKPKLKSITKTFRTHKNYSKENLQNTIKEHTLHLNEILNTDNVNNQVTILNNVLKEAINKCAPLITTRVKRQPNKWMNDIIKKKIEEREIKKNIWLSNKSSTEALTNYKDAKREVSKEIRNSKAKYYHEELTINKNDSRKTWNIINDLTKGNMNRNNSQINASYAGNFNEYFSQVGLKTYEQVTKNYTPNELNLNLQQETRNPKSQQFRPQPTDIPTVINIIKNLKNTSSYGVDDIPCKCIKDTNEITAPYIIIIDQILYLLIYTLQNNGKKVTNQ